MGSIIKIIWYEKSTGFGLGLPLSKDIIEAHKGKIAVDSKEGKGTTVRIRLPAD